MDLEIEYLLNFLEDELGSVPGVRIRGVFPSTTRRSPDLPQDYDPESNQLHSERGARVYVGSRDFFFPAQWVASKQFALIHEQAAEIRERFLS